VTDRNYAVHNVKYKYNYYVRVVYTSPLSVSFNVINLDKDVVFEITLSNETMKLLIESIPELLVHAELH